MQESFGICVFRNCLPEDFSKAQIDFEPIIFGVRGTGSRYQRFWEWMRSEGLDSATAQSFSMDDFPWSYFAFKDTANSERLLEEWSIDCYENNEDNEDV